MRLFTGIAPAPNVIDRLSVILGELRFAARINWSPVRNLHITCKFIGEWPEDRLPEMETALATVAVAAPIPIPISQFGFFPNPQRPHSFFADVQAGAQAGAAFAELAGTIDRALTPLGCAAETRPYRPHITLARIKPGHDIHRLRQHIAAMTDFDFGSFDARDFHLYLSKPAPGGSIYTKLATYDLMREKNEIS